MSSIKIAEAIGIYLMCGGALLLAHWDHVKYYPTPVKLVFCAVWLPAFVCYFLYWGLTGRPPR